MEDKLDKRLIEKIIDNVREKESHELMEVYKNQDLSRWSPEYFTAIRSVLEERGVDIPVFDVNEESAERKKNIPEKKEGGECLRIFLIFSGLSMLSSGFYWLFFLSRGVIEILVAILFCLFSSMFIFTGFRLKFMLFRHPKLIYSVLLTDFVSILVYIGKKFDEYLVFRDIVFSLILLVMIWVVFRSAIALRLTMLEKTNNFSGCAREKKLNRMGLKIFIISFSLIIALGIIRIQIFPLPDSQRAEFLLYSGREREALDIYRGILAKRVGDMDACIGELTCLIRLKWKEEAEPRLQHIWEISASDPFSRIYVIRLVNLIWKDYSRALVLLEEIKTDRPKNRMEAKDFDRMFFGNLGWALLNSEKPETALEAFTLAKPLWDQALALDSLSGELSEIELFYGCYYDLMGDKNQAINHWQRVVKNPIFDENESMAKEKLKRLEY